MKPRLLSPVAVTLLISSLIFASNVQAIVGTLDNVPAATLLFPYFEVDTALGGTLDTQLAITNASASASLVNVVVWTDQSVPVAQFQVYLTGYDVQRISLRDLIVNGIVPKTASDGQDPSDTISPQGSLSQDINLASCTGILPPANLDANAIAALKAALTGNNSTALGGCGGTAYGDGIARGYVTVDEVTACSSVPHSDPAYYTGIISYRNILLGDYAIVDTAQGQSHGGVAVAIEASLTDSRLTTSGRYTFYGRYNGFTATDHREPLGSKWMASYARNASHVQAWRDTKQVEAAFPCGSTQTPYPLGQRQIVALGPTGSPSYVDETASRPLPFEAGSVLVGGSTFPVQGKFGWLFLDFDDTTASPTNPPASPRRRQSFVRMVVNPEATSNGQLTFGFSATLLESAIEAVQGSDLPHL